MSFFSEQDHQEHAQIAERRRQDAEKIVATCPEVMEDILRRARLVFHDKGSVDSVSGQVYVKGFMWGDYESREYQQALRAVESYVVDSFMQSRIVATAQSYLSKEEHWTEGFANADTPNTTTVHSLHTDVTFDPPLI